MRGVTPENAGELYDHVSELSTVHSAIVSDGITQEGVSYDGGSFRTNDALYTVLSARSEEQRGLVVVRLRRADFLGKDVFVDHVPVDFVWIEEEEGDLRVSRSQPLVVATLDEMNSERVAPEFMFGLGAFQHAVQSDLGTDGAVFSRDDTLDTVAAGTPGEDEGEAALVTELSQLTFADRYVARFASAAQVDAGQEGATALNGAILDVANRGRSLRLPADWVITPHFLGTGDRRDMDKRVLDNVQPPYETGEPFPRPRTDFSFSLNEPDGRGRSLLLIEGLLPVVSKIEFPLGQQVPFGLEVMRPGPLANAYLSGRARVLTTEEIEPYTARIQEHL